MRPYFGLFDNSYVHESVCRNSGGFSIVLVWALRRNSKNVLEVGVYDLPLRLQDKDWLVTLNELIG